VEVTRPFVRDISNQVCAGAEFYEGASKRPPQARRSVKGEFP